MFLNLFLVFRFLRVMNTNLESRLYTSMNNKHRPPAASLVQLKHLVHHQSLPHIIIMSSPMTKTEIIEELARLGELPPKSWSRTECLVPMEELREAQGLTSNPKSKAKTPLQLKMTQLNAASRKKSDLISFCHELQIPMSGHETIPILQKKATQVLLDQCEATGADPVGFGVHAALSYQEVKISEPNYANWVITTFQEERNTCPRLARLAQWLIQEQRHSQKPEITELQSQPPIPREVLIEKGYIKTPKGAKAAASMTSKQSGAASSNMTGVTSHVLKNLTEAVIELKEQVQSLKTGQEPPRKKTSQASEQSFEMILENQ